MEYEVVWLSIEQLIHEVEIVLIPQDVEEIVSRN